VWTQGKNRLFLKNRCHSQDWLGWLLSTLRRSNSDVNVIENHLKLVEKVHTFCLDSNFLSLKVCNFIFICLIVSTWSAQNFKMQGKLIRYKMLETSMEKLGCKHIISWAWGYAIKSLINHQNYNSFQFGPLFHQFPPSKLSATYRLVLSLRNMQLSP
jgi:uncharacterized membrane protein YbjE (DUF340 family)